MKKFYSFSYILLAVLTIISLTIAAIASVGTLLRIAAISSLVIFTVLQIVCLLLYRGTGRAWIYRTGFYILHGGLVLALTGCGVYALAGDSSYAPVPVGNGVYYSEIMREDGSLLSFGFSVSVKSFRVEKYEDTGEDKEYEAVLSFMDESGKAEERSLMVNRPVRHGGWKIYLMSYDETGGTTAVSLLFKKDPVEFVSTAGFWGIIVGSFLMCLFPAERRKKA